MPFFDPFQSFLRPFQQVVIAQFKLIHDFIHQIKMQIFDPQARGNGDTATGCQMISYSQIDLNRSEHLKINLKNLTLH